MKKIISILILLTIGSSLFCAKKAFNYEHELSFSVGPLSLDQFIQDSNIGNVPFYRNMKSDSMSPHFELEYTFYPFKHFGFGASCNYDNALFTLDSKDYLFSNVGILANLVIQFPTRFITYYARIGGGLVFTYCDIYKIVFDESPLQINAGSTFGVLGFKFPITNNFSIFTEANLGSTSLVCIGISKGFKDR